MAKFRKHPSGEFPGFPFLKKDDLTHEAFQDHAKFMAQGLIEDRMGHVMVKMEGERYLRFLEAVKKKYGNIWSNSVHNAMDEAIDMFMKEVGV